MDDAKEPLRISHISKLLKQLCSWNSVESGSHVETQEGRLPNLPNDQSMEFPLPLPRPCLIYRLEHILHGFRSAPSRRAVLGAGQEVVFDGCSDHEIGQTPLLKFTESREEGDRAPALGRQLLGEL